MIKNSKLYIRSKKLFKATIHSWGFDVIRYNVHTSEDVLLDTIIKHFKIDTILDVGANEGQYAQGIFEKGFSGNVYSFEPIKEVFQKLKTNSAMTPGWFSFNAGVGSKE